MPWNQEEAEDSIVRQRHRLRLRDDNTRQLGFVVGCVPKEPHLASEEKAAGCHRLLQQHFDVLFRTTVQRGKAPTWTSDGQLSTSFSLTKPQLSPHSIDLPGTPAACKSLLVASSISTLEVSGCLPALHAIPEAFTL